MLVYTHDVGRCDGGNGRDEESVTDQTEPNGRARKCRKAGAACQLPTTLLDSFRGTLVSEYNLEP